MDEIEKMIKIIGKITESESKVVKSIPAKKEWIAMKDEGVKIYEKIKELQSDLEIQGKKMWATIEMDMNDFKTRKQFNQDKNTIEIMGEKDDSAIKSPYFKK